MTYTVTEKDFIGDDDKTDLFYIGPLEPAQEFIRSEYAVTESVNNGVHTVLAGSVEDGTEVTWEHADLWGRGFDAETAWRYLIAAEFGPLDAEFHPIELTKTGLDAVDDYIDTELDNGSMYR